MRIVVVDPSRTVLKIVTRLLEAGQHQVCPFTDGPEAIAHIRADYDVDALITSAELPSMCGMISVPRRASSPPAAARSISC